MNLQGRIAVVTGGATGIGNGIARALAAQGARLAIVQPSAEQAEEAARALPEAAGFEADIRDRAAVERMMAEVLERFGGIDILVNNASVTGVRAVAGFITASPDHVSEVLDVNVKGTIWCSRAAARHMIAGKRPGAIVHIASVGAFAAQELASIYCASKAAQTSLAQSMALELAPHGIRVNAVAPGAILTEASAGIVTDLKTMGATGKYLRVTPLGRRGSPEGHRECSGFPGERRGAFYHRRGAAGGWRIFDVLRGRRFHFDGAARRKLTAPRRSHTGRWLPAFALRS